MFPETIACQLFISPTASKLTFVLVFDVATTPQGTAPGLSIVLQQWQEWSCGGKNLTICQDLHELEPTIINKYSNGSSSLLKVIDSPLLGKR